MIGNASLAEIDILQLVLYLWINITARMWLDSASILYLFFIFINRITEKPCSHK